MLFYLFLATNWLILLEDEKMFKDWEAAKAERVKNGDAVDGTFELHFLFCLCE
jgi:hypothetical protein